MKTLLTILLLLGTAWGVNGHLNIEQKSTEGIASWYGRREQGRRQANGKPFDRQAYTCASLHYRLGTLLRVSFPQKGTFVVVRVCDRGPWVKGRILDLSEQAADTLGLKPYGVGRVIITPERLFQ